MIDLSQLPPPDVVETLDFEAIYQERLAQFRDLYPDFDALLESDPVVKLLELVAYLEVEMRARINDAARAVMLAKSTGADLDQLAALLDVERLEITPADEDAGTDAINEDDDSLRARVQLAPEGFAVAGPVGAYRYHALSASGVVKDVAVDTPRFARIAIPTAVASYFPESCFVLQATHSAGLPDPMPGDVAITVLSTESDGTPDLNLLETVGDVLSDDDVRPLTDRVRVLPPAVRHYAIEAELTLYPGPSADPVREQARAATELYAANTHRLGYDVTLSGLYAALHQPGVQRVRLISPTEDVVCAANEAAWCSAITISTREVNDV